MLRRSREIDRLITRYGLHRDGAPVDLSPLKEEFELLIRPIPWRSFPGLVIPPVAKSSPAVVVLNAAFPENWRRIYLAHEIAHSVHGHPPSHRTLATSPRWHRKIEREAWRSAAQLLIPDDVIEDGSTYLDIAMLCRVPLWLAERHPKAIPPWVYSDITDPWSSYRCQTSAYAARFVG